MKIMRLLLALAVGAYAYSQNVMVAWIATWFIVGLANRENTFENDQKETFEMLQTGATIVTPMFAVALVVDSAQSLYQLLDKVRGSVFVDLKC
ncbi:hypothetical protein PHMEG_00027709 [Phytophthora megakarya]|uniref:Uncharacterized protein n=1 Tax=Phytophthora megakarya TaxID=4795 RepID=A0A225V7Q0_9STRA|nr:hypothetical protein PHMEG_00027709 [Phytophthora megakarya]